MQPKSGWTKATILIMSSAPIPRIYFDPYLSCMLFFSEPMSPVASGPILQDSLTIWIEHFTLEHDLCPRPAILHTWSSAHRLLSATKAPCKVYVAVPAIDNNTGHVRLTRNNPYVNEQLRFRVIGYLAVTFVAIWRRWVKGSKYVLDTVHKSWTVTSLIL